MVIILLAIPIVGLIISILISIAGAGVFLRWLLSEHDRRLLSDDAQAISG